MKGILVAAGLDWQDRIPHGGNLVTSLHYFKLVVLLVVAALIWMTREALPKLNRLLSSLGFAFAVLAAVRLFVLRHTPVSAVDTALAVPSERADLPGIATNRETPDGRLLRRLVWVLFDETDFYLQPGSGVVDCSKCVKGLRSTDHTRATPFSAVRTDNR